MTPPLSDRFPQDVVELRALLAGDARPDGVSATPGRGTNVPLYILGSSLFGAKLAAALGLPFGFASHFAPSSLTEAVALYRAGFQPSEQPRPPARDRGVNVIAAETDAEAQHQFLVTSAAASPCSSAVASVSSPTPRPTPSSRRRRAASSSR